MIYRPKSYYIPYERQSREAKTSVMSPILEKREKREHVTIIFFKFQRGIKEKQVKIKHITNHFEHPYTNLPICCCLAACLFHLSHFLLHKKCISVPVMWIRILKYITWRFGEKCGVRKKVITGNDAGFRNTWSCHEFALFCNHNHLDTNQYILRRCITNSIKKKQLQISACVTDTKQQPGSEGTKELYARRRLRVQESNELLTNIQ